MSDDVPDDVQNLSDLVANLMDNLLNVEALLKGGTTFGKLRDPLEALWMATHNLIGSQTHPDTGVQVDTRNIVIPDHIPEEWS